MSGKIEIASLFKNNYIKGDIVSLFTDDNGWIIAEFDGLQFYSENKLIPYARILSKLNYTPTNNIKVSQCFLKEYHED